MASLVFPRLIKRDAITKVKALQELQLFFSDDGLPKKQQVDALAHYMYVYHSKLVYESASAVRAEALLVLTLAAQRVPKAFSTLMRQNDRRLLGMMYCCYGDPAAEVRTVATNYLQEEYDNNNNNTNNKTQDDVAYTLQDLQVGIWNYVERILSYGRANKMHEDLFATSRVKNTTGKYTNSSSSSGGGGGGGGGGGKNKNDTSSSGGDDSMNESQTDHMEEQFERIVGSALSGIRVWIQRHGILNNQNNDQDGDDHDDDDDDDFMAKSGILWKTLSSPKASLRNRTYVLLAVCCQKAPSIIFYSNNSFHQTIPQALASEKEAGNISSLLEALVTYLAAYSKHNPNGSPWDTMNAANVTKNLVKLFKKSCHGASATQWGPTLLPLLAMMPSLSDQVAILSSVWKGREQTVRMGDQMVVVSTVSESASYFLLRKDAHDTEAVNEDGVTLPKVLAQLWLDCLKMFLETNSGKYSTESKARTKIAGPVQQAQNALVKGLASELLKFDDACSNRPNCALYLIREWFWYEGISTLLMEVEGNGYLAMIVDEFFTQAKDSSKMSVYLSPIVREKFRQVLSGYQQSSGSIPNTDAYELMIVILKHCGKEVLANAGEEQDRNISVEKFLLNDVLKWSIIHTSLLSTQKQSKDLVRKDFELFALCIADIQSMEKQKHLWSTLLKEVIAADPKLDLFIAGLVSFLKHEGVTIEQVRSDALDTFVAKVVKDAVSASSSNTDGSDSHLEEESKLAEFLMSCAGLTSNVPRLVRRQVLITWIDCSCPCLDVDTMMDDTIVPAPVMDTLLKLVPSVLSEEEAYRVILQAWNKGGPIWDSIGIELLLKESDYLAALLDQGSNFLHKALQTWSAKPDNKVAGIAALAWSRKAWRLVNLHRRADLQGTRTPLSPLSLVQLGDLDLWKTSSEHDFHFTCLMYLLRNEETCAKRLALFQETDDCVNFTVAVFIALSEADTGIVSASRSSKRIDRCAQLLRVLGGRRIGKSLLKEWFQAAVSSLKHYVEEKDIVRVSKSVAVISQLCDAIIDRVKARDILTADDDNEDLGDEFEREKIVKMFAPILQKETFADLPWQSSFAELLNVAITQCGVGAERGIGSLHYDIFQLILGAKSRLKKLLTDSDGTNSSKDKICQELWLLSLACGFGLNTPSAFWDPQLLMFDPESITVELLDYIDQNESTSGTTAVGRSILAWFMTACVAIASTETRGRVLNYLFKQSTTLLTSCRDGDLLLGQRGIFMAQTASRKYGMECVNLNSTSMMQLLGRFFVWEDAVAVQGVVGQDFNDAGDPIRFNQPHWLCLSKFPEIVSSTLREEPSLMVTAAAEFSDELVHALSVESKRWHALRLLNAIGLSATSILGDPVLEESTAKRLEEWTRGLDEEEKGELEGDVEIVSELLPHALMTEMESWSEEDYEDNVDHSIIVGKMLAWLCCLQYVDSFVQKDSANRPSLCAYIDKSGAMHSILNFTILHTDVLSETDPMCDFDLLLGTEEMVNASNLASLVLFRTVEALPSLTRRWWEEECPKVYTGPMKDYIATHIAPVILGSELERLKLASNKNKFGDMTVSGSVSTREITALYVQDEIKLKVMIKLPSFFPLRNAEVDCSKTLGVPAKRWKLWSLQITMMLNNQGGTLQEALMLWKENVDQEFEGVEPCPVCYSVLHIKTHKLPELECSTCSNRFHSQCLTQWFRSSGKTQCVICQQQWAGTRVKK